MNKETNKRYLSELFLEKLNGDFSYKGVLRSLEVCNLEIIRRLQNHQSASDVIGCFLNCYGKKHKVSKQLRQEIGDFRDVYNEFDDMLSPRVKSNYLLLQMI